MLDGIDGWFSTLWDLMKVTSDGVDWLDGGRLGDGICRWSNENWVWSLVVDRLELIKIFWCMRLWNCSSCRVEMTLMTWTRLNIKMEIEYLLRVFVCDDSRWCNRSCSICCWMLEILRLLLGWYTEFSEVKLPIHAIGWLRDTDWLVASRSNTELRRSWPLDCSWRAWTWDLVIIFDDHVDECLVRRSITSWSLEWCLLY